MAEACYSGGEMKSHRTCSPDKCPSLPSLWAFALKEEWLEQCPYNMVTNLQLNCHRHLFCFDRVTFPSWKGCFYKPRGPFRCLTPGTPSNASQNQILQNTGLLVMPLNLTFLCPLKLKKKIQRV